MAYETGKMVGILQNALTACQKRSNELLESDRTTRKELELQKIATRAVAVELVKLREKYDRLSRLVADMVDPTCVTCGNPILGQVWDPRHVFPPQCDNCVTPTQMEQTKWESSQPERVRILAECIERKQSQG
jgi:hypothetical protein